MLKPVPAGMIESMVIELAGTPDTERTCAPVPPIDRYIPETNAEVVVAKRIALVLLAVAVFVSVYVPNVPDDKQHHPIFDPFTGLELYTRSPACQ